MADTLTLTLSSLSVAHLLLAKINATAIYVARTGKFWVKDFLIFFFLIKNLNLA